MRELFGVDPLSPDTTRKRAKSLLDEFAEIKLTQLKQGETIKEQGETINEQGETIKEQGKTITQFERDTKLLKILSMESYTGFSKEATFAEVAWNVDQLLETVDESKLKELWDRALDIRNSLLKDYKETEFRTPKLREPWLQKHVFIPLLALLSDEGFYRLHGNNIRLLHTHNSTYSTPDAILTHKNEFAVNPKTGGTVFELEHTIEAKNSEDNQDHFSNGRGQVIKYMIVEALAEFRPLFTGVLTDCSKIIFYKFDGHTSFHQSISFDLLCNSESPTQGFHLLARLFRTPPGVLLIPCPKPHLPDFKSFPHSVEVPTSAGSARKCVLIFDGILGHH